MATFYIQLENKLLQISGELTADNISKALGYVPVDSSTMSNYATKDEVSDLVDMSMVEELSQRVDNITFDSLKDNPFLQDGSGDLNIVDEAGNIIAKIDAEGIHSVDFIAGNHKLTDKIDSSALNGYAKESWVAAEITKAVTEGKVDLTGYATEEYVNTNLQNYATKDEVSDLVDMSVVTELQGKVNTLIDTDADKSVRDIAVDVLTETLVSETATEAYDTLAEMSAWIKSHPEDASAMNTAIQKNATDITTLDATYKAADTKVLTDAQEYTDNINFYTIKDNPIVDGEAGSITFVDETGYIGLKVTEDGIIAKDVVTPEHTLSSKVDKSFVEDNYYNKSTVDKKITEAVTGGQVSLDGYATEEWVNEQGFLKTHQDISHLAEKSELPTKTSDLTNDSGFITINDVPEVSVPTKTSDLTNDSGFITINDVPEVTVPTKTSDLSNDSGFITIDDVPEVTVPTKTSDLTNDSGFITIDDVPVQEIPEEYVTEAELNDKGFLTEHQDISHLASRNWVESQGYAHQEDLLEISFNDIQDSPISIDNSGMINFVDESGNVGFQINEEGLRVTDVISGEHKLSQKANASDIPSLDGLVKTEDLPNFDEFAKTEDIPSLDGYAKTEDIPSLDGYATEEWVNNMNYATEYDLKTIDYSSINNIPTLEDETGELNIADESGNIGMKVASEAVYAKDFVAGEHKLSEKVDKTYVDNSIAELVDGAPETLDTLNELAAALNDNADIVDVLNQSIGNKQDVITDLETIRQGAAKGATALQSYTEQYKGTVTGVKINGTTNNPSNGVVDIGTVITSHQDISGKQDTLVSGTSIKTINGESILGSGDIIIKSEKTDVPYLTIEVLEDECTIGFRRNTIQYSTNLNTWSNLTPGSTVSANAGDKLYFKSYLFPESYAGIGTFTVNKNFNLSGNCNSMVFGDNAAKYESLMGYEFTFYQLFYNCTTLQSVSRTFLPANGVSWACYQQMFKNCTSLRTAPDLPATKLYMECYYEMFSGCSNLNYIKMLATDISESMCLYNWVSGVSSTGTFVKNADATWDVTGTSGIPEGWTVEYPLDISGGATNQILAKTSNITHDTDWISVKTINGESILGSGDIVINSGTGSGYSDANVQAVDEISTIIDVDMDKYIVETTDDNIILDNNKYYKKTNVSSSISITLNIPEDNTVFTSFAIEFTTSDSGTSVSLPNTIKWLNGELPIFENNFTYQISIMNNLGVCAKYA